MWAQHLKGAYRGMPLDWHLTKVEGLEEATDGTVAIDGRVWPCAAS